MTDKPTTITTTQEDLALVQKQLEEEAIGIGATQFRHRMQKAQEKQRESATPAGRQLMSWAVPQLASGIQQFITEVYSGKAGPKAIAAKVLKDHDPQVVAYLTLRAIMDGISAQQRLQTIALSVSRYIEDEQRFHAIEKQAPGLWKKVTKQLSSQGAQYTHGRRVLSVAANNADLDLPKAWTSNERLQVGTKLCLLACQFTGLVERREQGRRGKRFYVLSATDACIRWMRKKNARCELSSPKNLPCVVPPAPWTNPWDGGYWYGLAGKLTLVKTKNTEYLDELSSTDLDQVYGAMNALQDTAWQVNPGILKIAQEAADTGVQLPGLVLGEERPIPTKPADIDTNEEARREWRKQAAQAHRQNARSRSKAMLVTQILWSAERMSEFGKIYYPYQMDFRGRTYPVVSGLQPQGPDLAKGLLRFAEGEPIGEEGAAWLAVHIANTYGQDKIPLDERVDWVMENEGKILEAAMDPLGAGRDWWTEADDPWQHLAACLDWLGYSIEGPTFRSRVPVAFDGSNNGLQHYSAMLRDRQGGKATNLVPLEKPADIYSEVLDKVVARCQQTAQREDDDHQEEALNWLQSGELDRKLCKRPCMTMPYGSKRYGIREQLVEELQARETEELSGSGYREAHYLSGELWDAIGETVVAAREGMDFLQELARLAAAEGLPIHWTSPIGLPVQQDYRSAKDRLVKTRWAGNLLQLKLKEDTDKIDKRRQANGIGPNVVHSLDASAMMLTVLAAKHEGLHSFSMVHDSFGTCAGRAGDLFRILREEFVRMYKEPVLEQLVEEISAQLSPESKEEVPEIPPKGTLDIEEVLESDYFFA